MECPMYKENGYCVFGKQCKFEHPGFKEVNHLEFLTTYESNMFEWAQRQAEKGLFCEMDEVEDDAEDMYEEQVKEEKPMKVEFDDERERIRQEALQRKRKELRMKEEELENEERRKELKENIQRKFQELKQKTKVKQEEEEEEEEEEKIEEENVKSEYKFDQSILDDEDTPEDIELYQKWYFINFDDPRVPFSHASHENSVPDEFRQKIFEKFANVLSPQFKKRERIIVHALEREELLYTKYVNSKNLYWNASVNELKRLPGYTKELSKQKFPRFNVKDEGEDEKRYCICNKPAEGGMVLCDNPKCENEWFHFGCVGLKKSPVGTWFCPNCKKGN